MLKSVPIALRIRNFLLYYTHEQFLCNKFFYKYLQMPDKILLSSLEHEEKIQTFKKLMAIRKNSESNRLEINQLIFNCHRNLSQFKNAQLLSTIQKNCNLSVCLREEMLNHIISECKKFPSS